MRLQYRLFFLLSGLLLLLVAAAVWGVRVLTADLGLALDEAGLSVGRAVVAVLDRTIETVPGKAEAQATHRLVVRRIATDRHDGHVDDHAAQGGPDPAVDTTSGVPGKSGQAVQLAQREFRMELNDRSGDLRLYSDGVQHLIQVPRSGVNTALERFSRSVLLGAVLVLVLGTALAFLLARRLARPLRDLAEAAGRVGSGELGYAVPVRGGPELRATLSTFNQMSSRLQALDGERRRLLELKGLAELTEVGRGIAHSMRNPLNTLGLSIDALAAGSIDAAPSEALRQRARDQIRRIDDALKSFLVLGTTTSGYNERVDLRSLLDDLLLEASQRAAGRVRFAVTAPEQPTWLAVQAHELRAALQALLVNALEASPDGAELEITLEMVAQERCRVLIADHGPGISAAMRDRLFTPHATTKPDGAGMGLFLAQRILKDRYDGTLQLLDHDGGGTLAIAEFGARCDG